MLFSVCVILAIATWTAQARAAGSRPEVEIADGKVTTLQVQPKPQPQANLGRAPSPPFERDQAFAARVPSYRLGIAMDAQQRWSEAADFYALAMIELGRAVGLDDRAPWGRAAEKIDLERRRAQVLARETAAGGPGDSQGQHSDLRPHAAAASARLAPLEVGRLLRLKLMTVRAATGVAPSKLVGATVEALNRVLTKGAPAGGALEARLLLCATRAAAGDRLGARRELGSLSPRDRDHPGHALAAATCQAALGDTEDALASLAVGVYRLGPASRFLPDQTRELQGENDWDVIRDDPRFERLFR